MAENVQPTETAVSLKDLAKKLYGKVVTLSPRNAFFIDADKQYVLSAYGTIGDTKQENSTDRVVVKEGWKLYSTMMAVKHGLLRVLDGEKDVTAEFGGRPISDDKATPLVNAPSKPVGKEPDKRDQKLMEILAKTRDEDVLKDIAGRKFTFDALERLLQLEIAGENPSFSPRLRVVDGIRDIMKATTGIGEVRKMDDAEETTVTAAKR